MVIRLPGKRHDDIKSSLPNIVKYVLVFIIVPNQIQSELSRGCLRPLAYFFNHGNKGSLNSFDLPPLAGHTGLVTNEIGNWEFWILR
jgi:hypothetical protein